VGASGSDGEGTFDPVDVFIGTCRSTARESLAVNCQSLAGKPAAVDVSSNLIELFSFA